MAFISLRILFVTYVMGLTVSFCVAETSTLNEDLLRIDHQLSQAKHELSAVAKQMRDAKHHVTEKEIELARHKTLLNEESTNLHAGRLQHARQRVALAKMAVDAAAAKFERIQRRMEDLAGARVALLTSRDNQVPQSVLSEPAAPAAKVAVAPVAAPAFVPTNDTRAAPTPVLTAHGKLSDPSVIADELQKLERHLITADAPREIASHAKAFGSTIAGEIALEGLGANQFFARFTATQTQTKIVAGARFTDFVRTSVDLEFTADEMGQEFILIFDANHTEEPRAIVFQSTLMPSDEAFAAHQRF